MWVKYDVSVGSASRNGTVFVEDNATDDEIRIAIMEDMYYINYKKVDEDDQIRIEYEIGVGGGCRNGSTYVSKGTTDDDIKLQLSHCMYYFEYEVEKEESDFKEDE